MRPRPSPGRTRSVPAVLLFVSSTGFDLWEFTYVASSCILGVVALSAAVVGYWFAPMHWSERWVAAFAGVVFIAPKLGADLAGLVILAPVAVAQWLKRRAASATPA